METILLSEAELTETRTKLVALYYWLLDLVDYNPKKLAVVSLEAMLDSSAVFVHTSYQHLPLSVYAAAINSSFNVNFNFNLGKAVTAILPIKFPVKRHSSFDRTAWLLAHAEEIKTYDVVINQQHDLNAKIRNYLCQVVQLVVNKFGPRLPGPITSILFDNGRFVFTCADTEFEVKHLLQFMGVTVQEALPELETIRDKLNRCLVAGVVVGLEF